MSLRIPPDELSLIREVERLGQEGHSLSEIARRLGKPIPTLRYQIEKHGLRAVQKIEIRSKIGGACLSDLLERGDIAAFEAPAEVVG